MSKAQLFMDYLREEGYVPRLDQDGDVVFKFEGATYLLFADEKDPMAFRLALPNFREIKNTAEERHVKDIINEMHGRLKVVKFFIPRNDLWASVELFFQPIDDFKAVFPRAIRLLANAVSALRERMQHEHEEEADDEI